MDYIYGLMDQAVCRARFGSHRNARPVRIAGVVGQCGPIDFACLGVRPTPSNWYFHESGHLTVDDFGYRGRAHGASRR